MWQQQGHQEGTLWTKERLTNQLQLVNSGVAKIPREIKGVSAEYMFDAKITYFHVLSQNGKLSPTIKLVV